MVNQTKIYKVEDLAEKIKAAKTLALIDYQGLTAAQVADLRDKIKEAGGFMEVAKNTLIIRALAKVGILLDQPLAGPTALIFANEDEVSPIKTIGNFKKALEKPEFKLGIYQKSVLSAQDLIKLASLPNKEILLSQLVNILNSPLFRLVSALKFNQTKLVLVIKALAQKQN